MTKDEYLKATQSLQDLGIITKGHGWKQSLADKLGVTRTTLDNFERDGTKQKQTDYAIAALLAGLEPYPSV